MRGVDLLSRINLPRASVSLCRAIDRNKDQAVVAAGRRALEQLYPDDLSVAELRNFCRELSKVPPRLPSAPPTSLVVVVLVLLLTPAASRVWHVWQEPLLDRFESPPEGGERFVEGKSGWSLCESFYRSLQRKVRARTRPARM